MGKCLTCHSNRKTTKWPLTPIVKVVHCACMILFALHTKLMIVHVAWWTCVFYRDEFESIEHCKFCIWQFFWTSWTMCITVRMESTTVWQLVSGKFDHALFYLQNFDNYFEYINYDNCFGQKATWVAMGIASDNCLQSISTSNRELHLYLGEHYAPDQAIEKLQELIGEFVDCTETLIKAMQQPTDKPPAIDF